MRPATPLAVLFFIAFALLLLSSLSTPVIKGIPIASHNGYKFGVLGFCEGDKCSSVGIGYDMSMINHVQGWLCDEYLTNHSAQTTSTAYRMTTSRCQQGHAIRYLQYWSYIPSLHSSHWSALASPSQRTFTALRIPRASCWVSSS
jgi:hypothetical protein